MPSKLLAQTSADSEQRACKGRFVAGFLLEWTAGINLLFDVQLEGSAAAAAAAAGASLLAISPVIILYGQDLSFALSRLLKMQGE